jgi:hypothetical protein
MLKKESKVQEIWQSEELENAVKNKKTGAWAQEMV